ncbi:FkbM family methyltransferase [Fontivita pretiosa]|uniref:FkbM family methyltransferase n=1 Tax=Fontivita pretiosa TaxID=2989684 RepID=UPI003D170553
MSSPNRAGDTVADPAVSTGIIDRRSKAHPASASASASVLSDALYRMKQRVRSGPARTIAHRTGLLGAGRAIYNRMLLRRGIARREICGQVLDFVVRSRFEITEIDGLFEERAFIDRCLNCLRDGDVLFDVGANIGIVSLAAARRAEGMRDVTVHAFEPEPGNLRRLQDNIELNELFTVNVEPVALGRQPGHAELYLAEGEFAGGSHAIAPTPATGGRSIRIELDSVDNRARVGEAVPTVMKIDVEGAEMEVLLGAERTILAGRVRELFIEVHVGRIFTEGFDPQRLQSWLEARDFELVWSRPRGTEIHQHYVLKGC